MDVSCIDEKAVKFEYFEEVSIIADKQGDNMGKALAHGNIGTIYFTLDSFDLAIKNFGITQKLIENDIKYNQSEFPMIHIYHEVFKGKLKIIVSDNGLGELNDFIWYFGLPNLFGCQSKALKD